MRLVLLHALPLDGRMWAREVGWARTAGIDVWAPTLYRRGDTVEEWADSVAADAGDDDLVVVGCSVGGSCALEVAARVPEQIAALVLIGAKAGHRPDPALRDEAVALLRSGGVAAAWDRYWGPLFGPGAAPAVVADARAIALDQDVDDVVRGVRAFHSRRDLTSFAETWGRPLVVIAGEADPSPTVATMATLAASARHGQLHVVPGVGHYVNLEAPDLVAAILADLVGDRR